MIFKRLLPATGRQTHSRPPRHLDQFIADRLAIVFEAVLGRGVIVDAGTSVFGVVVRGAFGDTVAQSACAAQDRV